MPRADRNQPGASSSPLVDLEAELRALDRKRLRIVRDSGLEPERRFEPPAQVEPGSWSDLERKVWLERAA